MTYLADAQPFWENGASVFWVVVGVGWAVATVVRAFLKGDDE